MATYRVETEGGVYDVETEDQGLPQDVQKPEQNIGQKVLGALDAYGKAGISNAVGMANGVTAGLARPSIKAMTGKDIGEGSLIGRIGGVMLPAGLAGKGIGAIAQAANPLVRGALQLGGEGAISALGTTPEESFKKFAESAPSKSMIGAGANIAGGSLLAGAGKLYNKIPENAKAFAYREINSLIKPMKKMFNYGKNPGKAIVDEGIVANNLDDLASQVDGVKQKTWSEISSKVKGSNAQIDLSQETKPLDDLLTRLKKSPNSNASAISRAEGAKDDLLGIVRNKKGNIVSQKDLSKLTPQEVMDFKQQIGDITKFTQNQTDDNLVNKALRSIYGSVKEKLNNAVKGISDLTEKYANFLDAGNAIKNREAVEQAKPIIGFIPKATMYLGSAAMGGLGGAAGTVGKVAAAKGLDELGSSTAAKTRFAQWLANKVANAPRGSFGTVRKGARIVTGAGSALLNGGN